MGPVAYFFWLAAQAIGVGLFLMPLHALAAFVGLFVAGVAAFRDPASLRGRWIWLVLPFALTVAILAFGVAFNYGGPIGSVPAWREQVLQGLVWLHVPVALVILMALRRAWPVVLGASVFQLWLSYSCSIMSTMSVTNGWL
jgi:hypothetical protein